MKTLLNAVALSFALLPSIVLASPRYFVKAPFSKRGLSSFTVQTELGPTLSKNATIFGPSDSRFENATERHSTHAVPKIEVVVAPGTESDVSIIVEYCNENSIDFFAINRAHARTYSVGAFDGLMIDLGSLRDIDIQPDGESAWFQGGTYDGQVMDYLWERGYVATTGSCDCVGMMGPGLGGGHGRHEGLYGMISDNILQLNVVLANGSAIRVNETSHQDLIWGMKGAGHNFGIVTSFELKIHPRGPDTWHYHNYIFTGDKLEKLFKEANKFHDGGNTPVNMALNYASFAMNESISTTEAVIPWTFAYRGPAEEAEELLAPFNDIEAVYEEFGDVPYPEISVVQGTDVEGFGCAKGHAWSMSTASMKVYNVTTTRRIYELFNENVRRYPELLSPSITHEGYSNAAVRAFKAEDSAFPFREYNHLTSFNVIVPPGSNLTSVARKWADDTQNLWNEGQPDVSPSNYVNYATGLDNLPSMYGYEPWRLERLIELKRVYDPFNRFRFYNPIIKG